MPSERIWVGGYTEDMNGRSEGITLLAVLPDGSLELRGLATATASPSYLALSGDVLYAVGEGVPSVSAFRVTGDELNPLGARDAAGTAPCSLAVLRNRSFLVASCYGDGVVDVHPLAQDGAIGSTGQSLRGEGRGPRAEQDGPHAHDALQIDETTVLTTDLGADAVHVHALGADGLTRTGSIRFPAGVGPRDLLLHPSGALWVLTELSAEIFVLRREAGGFTIVGSVGLPGAEPGDHASALAISADGRFAYAGLRGSNRVAVFAVAEGGERLTPVDSVGSGGGGPRHLVMDGDRLRVANQLTDSVVTFGIGADGIPVPQSSLTVPSPTFLLPA